MRESSTHGGRGGGIRHVTVVSGCTGDQLASSLPTAGAMIHKTAVVYPVALYRINMIIRAELAASEVSAGPAGAGLRHSSNYSNNSKTSVTHWCDNHSNIRSLMVLFLWGPCHKQPLFKCECVLVACCKTSLGVVCSWQ